MSTSITINIAFPLPAPDIEALIEGRMIVAMSRKFVHPGKQFALYPCNTSINLLLAKEYYCSNFLPTAQNTLAKLDTQKVLLQAWARCELCQGIEPAESLKILSQLTVWTEAALQANCLQQGHIFLVYLRVYQLPEPVAAIPVQSPAHFIRLPQLIRVNEAIPVLSDHFFLQQRQYLENRQLPKHPELQELYSAITQLSDSNPGAKSLEEDIRKFLGWSSQQPTQQHPTHIINPETLEKLVKLQALYPNSVDLFELKKHLIPGQADDQVTKYITQVQDKITLRSHLVQLVKDYLQDAKLEDAGVDDLHGKYFGSQPSQPLTPEEMYEILIELSSPLTGYLGRIKDSDWRRDRFYFLRELS